MEQLKCPNCGGNVDRAKMKCPYCGTQFKFERNDVIRIETYNPQMRILEGEVVVDSFDVRLLGEEEMAKWAEHILAGKIAEALAPLMEVRASYDPARMEHRIKARARMLMPDYRF